MGMLQRFLMATVAVMVAGATLAAHISVPAAFREVVDDSGLIARGVVTDVRAVPVPDGGIDSIATVAIESVIKGESTAFVSVRLPGGEIGATRFVMVGAPTLRRGDRAVFLLKRGADNFWRPVGLSMGLYRVKPDATTGRPVVNPPVVAGRTASTGAVARGDTRRKAMPVAEFEALIRTLTLGRSAGRAVRR
jgi:hypothetical protein